MHKQISYQILENPQMLNKLMEHSYWIKLLNRNPGNFNVFKREMKVIYKERLTDKVNSAIDSLEMVEALMDTLK